MTYRLEWRLVGRARRLLDRGEIDEASRTAPQPCRRSTPSSSPSPSGAATKPRAIGGDGDLRMPISKFRLSCGLPCCRRIVLPLCSRSSQARKPARTCW